MLLAGLECVLYSMSRSHVAGVNCNVSKHARGMLKICKGSRLGIPLRQAQHMYSQSRTLSRRALLPETATRHNEQLLEQLLSLGRELRFTDVLGQMINVLFEKKQSGLPFHVHDVNGVSIIHTVRVTSAAAV